MPAVFYNTTTATTTTTNPIWITCATTTTYANPTVALTAPAVRRHTPEAETRARDLLLQHLSPEQRSTFKRHKWFVVEGGRTGKRYRVRDLGHLRGNVDVLDGERVDHRLCGHADQNVVPLEDNLLAQKLMLEADEDEFLALANRHAA